MSPDVKPDVVRDLRAVGHFRECQGDSVTSWIGGGCKKWRHRASRVSRPGDRMDYKKEGSYVFLGCIKSEVLVDSHWGPNKSPLDSKSPLRFPGTVKSVAQDEFGPGVVALKRELKGHVTLPGSF